MKKRARIEKILETNKYYEWTVRDNKMFPMVMKQHDTVVLVSPTFPLKKYDVPVYKIGRKYFMKRVIEVKENGYVLCADNSSRLEKEITDKDIVGVVTAFYHNGNLIDCSDEEYLKYAKKVCRRLPIRIAKGSIKVFFKKLFVAVFC